MTHEAGATSNHYYHEPTKDTGLDDLHISLPLRGSTAKTNGDNEASNKDDESLDKFHTPRQTTLPYSGLTASNSLGESSESVTNPMLLGCCCLIA